MRKVMNRRTTTGIALAASTVLLVGACGSGDDDGSGAATFAAQPVLEPGEEDPSIAQGVTIGKDVFFYKSSGLGPEALNEDAESGTPEAFLMPDHLSDGELTDGITVTESQGLNALARIKDNLEQQGLTLQDVVSMRVFLASAEGQDRADYDGWNRAYKQYFANTNLETDDTILVPLGEAEPAAPIERNHVRPSRFALEVASLPVEGWLVEVEVDAVYPRDREPQE